MGPKLPININKTKFEFLPDWASGDSWFIHDKYWIDQDYQPPQVERIDDKPQDYGFDFWNFELETVKASYKVEGKLTFKKDKYIRWTPKYEDLIRYRISDNPNLFVKFAAIGRDIEPDEKKVLQFIKKYGVLKIGMDTNIIEDSDHVFFSGGFFPYKTFCEYANEAYYALRLYEGIRNRDIDTLREILIKGFNFECLYGLYSEVFDIQRVGEESIPSSVKEEYLRSWIPEEADKLNVSVLGHWKAFIGHDLSDGEYKTLWIDVINEAFPQFIIDLAVDALGFIFHLRITDKVGCGIEIISPQESGSSTYIFKDRWGGQDLLSMMWFSFFLKVTGKLETEYKICPECGLPIIAKEGQKLRKDTIYHHGCRQTHFNREKREVLKLRKKGLSCEEIEASTGTKIDKIRKWVDIN